MDVPNNKNERIVIEKLSQINFTAVDDIYVLHDLLRDVKFDVNKSFYYICQQIDGQKSVAEIAANMASEYSIPLSEAIKSVSYVIRILIKRRLALVKGGLQYNFIKCFYLLTGYKY